MMAQSYLPVFPPFVVGENPTAVTSGWNKGPDRFENYLAARVIKDATRKRAMLLHFAGNDIYQIFHKLENTGEAKEYDTAKAKLTEHFKPQQNVEYERYIFRRTQQNANETLDQYYTRLKQLRAAFPTPPQKSNHTNSNSSRLRRRALRNPKLTLKELLDLSRTLETSERHALGIEQDQRIVNEVQIQGTKGPVWYHRNPANNRSSKSKEGRCLRQDE